MANRERKVTLTAVIRSVLSPTFEQDTGKAQKQLDKVLDLKADGTEKSLRTLGREIGKIGSPTQQRAVQQIEQALTGIGNSEDDIRKAERALRLLNGRFGGRGVAAFDTALERVGSSMAKVSRQAAPLNSRTQQTQTLFQRAAPVIVRAGSALLTLQRRSRSAVGGLLSLSGAMNALRAAASPLSLLLAGFLGVNAIAGVAKLSDAYTTQSNRIRLLAEDTAELVETREDLFRISQETLTQSDSTVDLYFRIGRSVDRTTFALERQLAVTKAIGQATQIGGGNQASVDAAIIQFGQLIGSNEIAAAAQELNSIREQTPRLFQAILEGLGTTRRQLLADITDGKILAIDLLEAIESQAGNIGAEFDTQVRTIQQGITLVGNSFQRLIGIFSSTTGAGSGIFTLLESISDGIDQFAGELEARVDKLSFLLERSFSPDVSPAERQQARTEAFALLDGLKDALIGALQASLSAIADAFQVAGNLAAIAFGSVLADYVSVALDPYIPGDQRTVEVQRTQALQKREEFQRKIGELLLKEDAASQVLVRNLQDGLAAIDQQLRELEPEIERVTQKRNIKIQIQRDLLDESIEDLSESVSGIGQSVVDNVLAPIDELPQRVKPPTADAGESIGKALTDAWSDAIERGQDLVLREVDRYQQRVVAAMGSKEELEARARELGAAAATAGADAARRIAEASAAGDTEAVAAAEADAAQAQLQERQAGRLRLIVAQAKELAEAKREQFGATQEILQAELVAYDAETRRLATESQLKLQTEGRIEASGQALDLAKDELRVRELQALGQDREAQRLSLVIRQRRELERAAAEELPRLQQLQALELRRFEIESKRLEVLERIRQAQEAYRQAEEARERDVQTGAISSDEANAANLAGRESLQGAIAAGVQELEALRGEGGRFDGVINDAVESVKRLGGGFNELAPAVERTFGQGVSDALNRLHAQAENTYALAVNLIGTLANSLTNGVGQAIQSIASGTQDAGDAAREWGRELLSQLLQVIAQFYVLKAVSAGLKAFGLGGESGSEGIGGAILSAFGANRGGFIERARRVALPLNTGGAVPGRGPDRDSVLAFLTRGEFVLRRRAADFYGPGILEALNRQQIPREVFARFAKAAPQVGRALNAGGVVGGDATPGQTMVMPITTADNVRDAEREVAIQTPALVRHLAGNRSAAAALRQALGIA